MIFLLFTTLNCKGCLAFNRQVYKLAHQFGADVRLYDFDDSKHLMRNLAAARKYDLNRTPTLILECGGREIFRGEGDESGNVTKNVENLLSKKSEDL